ncbi:hypothetical protein BOO25_18890 [Vibrio navarrensis]|uniref:phage minor tail protein G n=1 Tax=Vibrio navarrensis TaxID=29495 RepID=UPI00192FB4C5|nr:phage minor tail protein G [Vibrio navarrensis]MBE3670997.1 hypothetical protein [Vibrio navarrensis]
MKVFLKTKTVEVDGEPVEVTQLSGLDRFNFLDYCTDLPKPKQPKKPGENATELEIENYMDEMSKCLKQWQRTNFVGQSRLVAYGYLGAGENLEDRHKQIMTSMTPDQVKFLHDEIAVFSGIPLPEEVAEEDSTSEASAQDEAVTAENADPKG